MAGRYQNVCMMVGGIAWACFVKAGYLEEKDRASMNELMAADAIIIRPTDAQAAALGNQKLTIYMKLAQENNSIVGILAQERAAIILYNGLDGQSKNQTQALTYLQAITNQMIDPSRRVRAFQMLARHYKNQGMKEEGMHNQESLKQAKEYLQRAYYATRDDDTMLQKELLKEIVEINHKLPIQCAGCGAAKDHQIADFQ